MCLACNLDTGAFMEGARKKRGCTLNRKLDNSKMMQLWMWWPLSGRHVLDYFTGVWSRFAVSYWLFSCHTRGWGSSNWASSHGIPCMYGKCPHQCCTKDLKQQPPNVCQDDNATVVELPWGSLQFPEIFWSISNSFVSREAVREAGMVPLSTGSASGILVNYKAQAVPEFSCFGYGLFSGGHRDTNKRCLPASSLHSSLPSQGTSNTSIC